MSKWLIPIWLVVFWLLLARVTEGDNSYCQPTPTLEPGSGIGIHLTPSWYPTAAPAAYSIWLPSVAQEGECR